MSHRAAYAVSGDDGMFKKTGYIVRNVVMMAGGLAQWWMES